MENIQLLMGFEVLVMYRAYKILSRGFVII